MHTAFIDVHSKTHNPPKLMTLIVSCVHMATLGFLATSLTQNIWIINAWLTTLRMGVHGRTNLTDKIHQIQIKILQCGILQLLFASNI